MNIGTGNEILLAEKAVKRYTFDVDSDDEVLEVGAPLKKTKGYYGCRIRKIVWSQMMTTFWK